MGWEVILIEMQRGRMAADGHILTRLPTAGELKDFFADPASHWVGRTFLLAKANVLALALQLQCPYRTTRKGWNLITTGPLRGWSWKAGYDFRSALPYIFVRDPGGNLYRSWPQAWDWYPRIYSTRPAELPKLYGPDDPIRAVIWPGYEPG